MKSNPSMESETNIKPPIGLNGIRNSSWVQTEEVEVKGNYERSAGR